MRDNKKNKQDQKNQKKEDRKKKENSKESKEARLKKIVARIRPSLQRIMGPGVPRPIMKLTLAGLRLWYKLTNLSLDGTDHGYIEAALNPRRKAVPFHTWDGHTEPSRLTEKRAKARTEEADEVRRIQEREANSARATQPNAARTSTPSTPSRTSMAPELARLLAAPRPTPGGRRSAPRMGPKGPYLTKGESVPYKEDRTRGETGDEMTPDHIPSGAAILFAAQRKFIAEQEATQNKKLSDQEVEDLLIKHEYIVINDKGGYDRGELGNKIYNEAQTLMVDESEHEFDKNGDREGGSRTFKGRNSASKVVLDGKDLTLAVEQDFRHYLNFWHKKGTLRKTQVYDMIRHYKRLADRNGKDSKIGTQVHYSDHIDTLLLYYWEKAK